MYLGSAGDIPCKRISKVFLYIWHLTCRSIVHIHRSSRRETASPSGVPQNDLFRNKVFPFQCLGLGINML